MPDVFWAAFGGGAAAGVFILAAVVIAEWFRWFLDRPLIKPKLSFGRKLHPVIKDDTLYLVFEAVNPHSKSVTLSSFGLLYAKTEWGKLQVNPDYISVPYELSSGKSISDWSPHENLLKTLKKEGKSPLDLKWVYFNASSGKVYRSKIGKGIIRDLEQRFANLK